MACQEMFLKAPRILDPWVSGYYVHFGRLCGKFQRDALVIVRQNPKITTTIPYLKTELRSGKYSFLAIRDLKSKP